MLIRLTERQATIHDKMRQPAAGAIQYSAIHFTSRVTDCRPRLDSFVVNQVRLQHLLPALDPEIVKWLLGYRSYC